MTSVCFYFQLHQPTRLRRYSVFEASQDYFDDARNRELLVRIAQKCYLPATRLILEQVQRHAGQFRVAFSLSGCVIEQLRDHAPEVLDLFRQLAETGCCEFLAETYHHSLAFLYSPTEFDEQVEMHRQAIEELFGQSPSVFRNTELVYNDALAAHIAGLGRYHGILAEGVDRVLDGRTPNRLYRTKDANLGLLLKNYQLSDDVAFRFSNQGWSHWPLTADKFADWLHDPEAQRNGDAAEAADVCNLFMDFETFGEHQWADTGILDFLRALPTAVLNRGDNFMTPSECIEAFTPAGTYTTPEITSWADTERDLSAWVGNTMQSSALQELYRLEEPIKKSGDHDLLTAWRRLTTSDHVYYMCTKYFADGEVHKYFNPYDSPYDAYINFVNVLDNLRLRVD